MTESERNKIISLYESGMGIRQIRQLMAMSVEDFNRAIRELKASGSFPKRKLGREKVAEAFARGERDICKIAHEYGLTPKTVKQYKVNLGIKTGRPKRNYRHCERTNAINEDLKEGVHTTAEIARKHGVKWQSVHKLRRKLEEDGEL